MKKLFFLLAFGIGLAVLAQTAAKPKAQKEPVGDTEINADRFDFIAENPLTNGLMITTNGLLIYTGHVLVENLRATGWWFISPRTVRNRTASRRKLTS